MLFFGNSPLAPHLTYHVADARGALIHSEVMDGPAASITENYVICFYSSAVIDLGLDQPFPYDWNDNYPARIGVMPRDSSKGGVRWIDVPSFYALHFANAWEDAEGKIIVEGPYFDRPAWDSALDFINGVAAHGAPPADGCVRGQWRIDAKAGTASVALLDDLTVEFPTINLAHTGRESRQIYACSFPGAGHQGCGIVKYDVLSGGRALLTLPDGVMAGEPCFVTDPAGTAEDHGWLLTYVSDLRSDAAELWILDATRIEAGPVAAIELPVWVPAGVHGSWIDDLAI